MRSTSWLLIVAVCCCVLASHPLAAQQTGRIVGKVVDSESGEVIIGANVIVEGTVRGASTDLDGKFEISIEAGSYTVLVKALSYRPYKAENIVVAANEKQEVRVALIPEAIQGEEVVIEGRVRGSYEGAMLAKQKSAVSIGDGMSAEQIKRAPDATSGDALRRLTGISLVDNKFVYVRGVTDRYNQTTLNGSPVASTDADKKSFSFDILPSNLLENATVVKTSSPDLRGDFTGGLVQLNTIDFPDSRTLRLTVGAAYHNPTTLNGFSGWNGGSSDWLGTDDGSRKFLDGYTDYTEMSKHLQNNWAPTSNKAPANLTASLAYGDRWMLDESEGEQIGFIGALTYKNGYQRSTIDINDLALHRFGSGHRDEYSVLWGAMANVSFKIGSHKISFKNNFNQSGEGRVSQLHINDYDAGPYENQFTSLDWNQRGIYSGQLAGEHQFNDLAGLNVNWQAAVSNSQGQVPDRKEITYQRTMGETSAPFGVTTNKRSWSAVHDHLESYGADGSFALSAIKLKGGVFTERRASSYRIRYFEVMADYQHGASESMTQLPLESIYDPQNYGVGKFVVNERSAATDSYHGSSNVLAIFSMADVPFTVADEKFRLVGGVRSEQSTIQVEVPRTLLPDGPTNTSELKTTDLLPSLNLTYLLNPVTNIRLGYSHSVNRPEFRELASTGFFDFITYELVGGNPNLQESRAKNYDIRFEFYPDAGELFAVSYFRKRITKPIEQSLVETAVRTRQLFNSALAVNSGWEVELRKSLNVFGRMFEDFSVIGNYSRIESEVKYTYVDRNTNLPEEGTRPMQGQSPYMMNGSLIYKHSTFGTSVSLLYNKFGRRLEAVGFQAEDVYEEAREMIDLTVTQPIVTSLEVRLTVKNIGNQDRILTRGGQFYNRTRLGSTMAFSISQSL